jgi:hypothetical protein
MVEDCMADHYRSLTLQVLFVGSLDEADKKGEDLAIDLAKKSYEDIGVNIVGLQKVGDDQPTWEINVSGKEDTRS